MLMPIQHYKTYNNMYRGGNKSLFVLLSRTQAGPGRTVKQGQQDISRNLVKTFIYLSVHAGRKHFRGPVNLQPQWHHVLSFTMNQQQMKRKEL